MQKNTQASQTALKTTVVTFTPVVVLMGWAWTLFRKTALGSLWISLWPALFLFVINVLSEGLRSGVVLTQPLASSGLSASVALLCLTALLGLLSTVIWGLSFVILARFYWQIITGATQYNPKNLAFPWHLIKAAAGYCLQQPLSLASCLMVGSSVLWVLFFMEALAFIAVYFLFSWLLSTFVVPGAMTVAGVLTLSFIGVAGLITVLGYGLVVAMQSGSFFFGLLWFATAEKNNARSWLDCFKAGYRLCVGNRFRVLLFFVLMTLFCGILSLAMAYPVFILTGVQFFQKTGAQPQAVEAFGGMNGVLSFLGSAIQVIQLPFYTAALVLFFKDLNARAARHDSIKDDSKNRTL
ncbi:MAG: hypothetical protein AAGI66_07640 [Cyanobacteria bacterium P01_H01_bin.74]